VNATAVVRNNTKVNPKSHEQGNAESKRQPVSLLAFLEAENARLRRTVIELALDTMDLRDAQKTTTAGTQSRPASTAVRSAHTSQVRRQSVLVRGVIWLLRRRSQAGPARGHDDGSRPGREPR
jgi:hypothetical protein